MYFVLISVILKHFLCIDHGNLVFPRGYSTDATLLANYWSDPGNQVGTYTGTQFGTNGTTCLLRHHTFILHTPLFIPCSWYTYSKGFTYYSTYQGNMAEGGDPPRHGAGRGRGEGGEPATTPTVGLPLQLKQPNFNWEGNVYENYKAFSERATILLGGPYAKYDDPSKISAFLSWTGDKGFQLYKNLDWERTGYDKSKWEDVVKAFGEELRIKELAKEGGFTNQEEIIKFLFLIHNNNTKLGNTLLIKLNPPKAPMIS